MFFGAFCDVAVCCCDTFCLDSKLFVPFLVNDDGLHFCMQLALDQNQYRPVAVPRIHSVWSFEPDLVLSCPSLTLSVCCVFLVMCS